MTTYYFKYVREQRVLVEVEAASWQEAERIANEQIQNLRLDSADDESDDPGELFYEGSEKEDV